MVTKNTYNLVIGESAKEFDYVIGEVASITAETTQVGKANPTVKYKVIDANGLDITASTAVTFESNEIIDANGKLTLAAGNSAFVYVTYKAGTAEEVKSARITVKAEASELKEFLEFTIASSAPTVADFEENDFEAVTNTNMGATGLAIYALAVDQFGDKSVVSGPAIGLSFESLDKTVALIDQNTGAITPIKEGTVPVRVKVGEVSKVVELTVAAKQKATSLSLDKNDISISDKLSTGQKVKVTVKDQFGNAVELASQNITATKKTGTDKLNINASVNTDSKGVAEFTVVPVIGKEGAAADIIAALGEKLEIKLGTDNLVYKAIPAAPTDYKITKVWLSSDNSDLLKWTTDAVNGDATKTTEANELGTASAVISKIEISVGTSAKVYTVDIGEVFNVSVEFKSVVDKTTANDVTTLGIIGTSVESDDTAVATAEIIAGKVEITSIGEGSATITVDLAGDTATIAVTVDEFGVITIGTITKHV